MTKKRIERYPESEEPQWLPLQGRKILGQRHSGIFSHEELQVRDESRHLSASLPPEIREGVEPDIPLVPPHLRQIDRGLSEGLLPL